MFNFLTPHDSRLVWITLPRISEPTFQKEFIAYNLCYKIILTVDLSFCIFLRLTLTSDCNMDQSPNPADLSPPFTVLSIFRSYCNHRYTRSNINLPLWTPGNFVQLIYENIYVTWRCQWTSVLFPFFNSVCLFIWVGDKSHLIACQPLCDFQKILVKIWCNTRYIFYNLCRRSIRIWMLSLHVLFCIHL